jgi:hypothetical protein
MSDVHGDCGILSSSFISHFFFNVKIKNAKAVYFGIFLKQAVTHLHYAYVVGYSSFFLCVIHEEDLFSRSGDIMH